MNTFFSSLYYGFIALVVALGILLLGIQTSFIEGYEVRIVQSGSMEPTILTGSLVFIVEQDSYQVDDIITFQASGPRSLPTTHRIVDDGAQAGNLVYYTKGDGNADADPAPVAEDEVIGEVVAWLPYIGYVLDFARQPLGFVLLIALPALFVMFDEMRKIWRELRGPKPVKDQAGAAKVEEASEGSSKEK